MNTSMNNASALLGRFLLVAIFIFSGIGKITGYAATQRLHGSNGRTRFHVTSSYYLRKSLGSSHLVGFKTRLVAFLMAGFSIVSAFIFHADFGDQNQMMNFMKNLAMAGGFLMIVAHGPGAYSIDARNQTETTITVYKLMAS